MLSEKYIKQTTKIYESVYISKTWNYFSFSKLCISLISIQIKVRNHASRGLSALAKLLVKHSRNNMVINHEHESLRMQMYTHSKHVEYEK